MDYKFYISPLESGNLSLMSKLNYLWKKLSKDEDDQAENVSRETMED